MQRLYLAIIASFICCSAAAQFGPAFRYDYPRRYVVFDSIAAAEKIYYSDSALQMIAGLRQLALRKDDKLAVLESDIMVFIYNTYYTGRPNYRYRDAKADVARLTDEAARLNSPYLAASAWDRFADFCYRDQLYFESFTASFKAYDSYKSLSASDYPNKRHALYYLALLYYHFNDYRQALRYCREALQPPVEDVNVNLWGNDLAGMCILRQGHPDAALPYFELTRQAAAKLDTLTAHGWDGIATGNMALCWEQKGDVDRAIPLFRQAITNTSKLGYWDNAAVFLTHLTGIYMAQGRTAEVARLLPDARIATYNGGDEEAHSRLYQLISDYDRATGNITGSLRYKDSAILWRDSLASRLDKNLKTQAELAYAEERYTEDTHHLNDKLRMQKLIRNGLVLLVLATCAIGFLLVRQRRQQVRLLRLKAERAAIALEQARERLRQITAGVQEKNALISKIEELPPGNEEADTGHRELLEELRSSVILTKTDWVDFQQVFELAYPRYIEALATKYPDCTPSEYRMLVLGKLGLSNKEMAAMLGVSQETIRSTRSRMRKKMGGGEGAEEVVAA